MNFKYCIIYDKALGILVLQNLHECIWALNENFSNILSCYKSELNKTLISHLTDF